MRPGGGPMPNFFVPMVQQGQQGQRPGGRRTPGGQQTQHPVPLMQQQVGGMMLALFLFYVFGYYIDISCYFIYR